MKKLTLTQNETTNLRALKEYYLYESETTEGEFADYLVDNINRCFNTIEVGISTVMNTIQSFRSWAHDRDELETEDYTEIQCEVNIITEGSCVYNEFQDYVYSNGAPVPESTRIGVENKGVLELDSGIFYP